MKVLFPLVVLLILALTTIACASAAPMATPDIPTTVETRPAQVPTATPDPTATPRPTHTPYPTPTTLHDEVDYLSEVAEQVANRMRVALVAVEASEEVRCLITNQEGEPEALKLERDFYATPAGRDWRGVWGGFLTYNPRREAVEEYVAGHGSEAALDYLKQLEDLVEPIIRACGG